MEMYYYEKNTLQFKLTPEELENTPSSKDGVTHETEKILRNFGCRFIEKMGILLEVPKVVTATAQVFFHRFYSRRSLKRFEVKSVAVGCVFLATKVDEELRKLREVVNVYHVVKQYEAGVKEIEVMDLSSRDYWNLKDEIILTERELLQAFGYMLYVELPHKFLMTALQTLGILDTPATQRSWNYVNDVLRTDMVLRKSPQCLAVAAIYFAVHDEGIALPKSPAWWTIFEVKLRDIEDICHAIHQLYSSDCSYIELDMLPKKPEEKAEKGTPVDSRKKLKKKGKGQRSRRSRSPRRSRSRSPRRSPHRRRSPNHRRQRSPHRRSGSSRRSPSPRRSGAARHSPSRKSPRNQSTKTPSPRSPCKSPRAPISSSPISSSPLSSSLRKSRSRSPRRPHSRSPHRPPNPHNKGRNRNRGRRDRNRGQQHRYYDPADRNTRRYHH